MFRSTQGSALPPDRTEGAEIDGRAPRVVEVARDLDHRTLNAGHFMAEEAPEVVVAALRGLLAR